MKSSLGFFLLIASFPLFSQLSPTPAPEMSWDAGRVILVDSEQGHRGFRILHQDPGLNRTLPAPPGATDLRHVQGSFWAVVPDATDRRVQRILRTENGVKWSEAAVFRYPSAMQPGRILAYPLSPSRFVILDKSAQGFELGDAKHLFVVAEEGQKGELVVRSPIDLGWKEPQFVKKMVGQTMEWVPNPSSLWIFTALTHSPFFTVGDSLVIGFFATGTYCVIDGHGRTLKTLRLFPGLDDAKLADSSAYERPVLCAQPRQDGQLLIASRSEDATLRGRMAFPRNYTIADLKDPVRKAAMEAKDIESLKNFPHVEWWLLDPVNKKLERTIGPDLVSDRIFDLTAYRKFWFTFAPSGNLVFPK